MTACPICGETADRQLNRFGLDYIAENFTPRMLDRSKYERMKGILAQLWKSDEVRVLRCDRCELGFADPFVAGTAEFYQLEAPDTPYPKDKWEYRRTLRSLEAQSAGSARLLDIGAGKGYFLCQLLKRGWTPDRLVATEFSLAGKKAIEALGVTCIPSDVRGVAMPHEFDVVCMFQVLEHLDDYDGLFEALARLTRPTADIFIAVPNGARVEFNEGIGLQYDCPPNHVSRWTPKSFQVLAAKYGWVVEECELEPPTTAVQEAAYAAINRYIRNSHIQGSWARFTYGLADRVFARASKANKAVKALGAAASPDVWVTSARVASKGRDGGIPHSLWAHLSRVP